MGARPPSGTTDLPGQGSDVLRRTGDDAWAGKSRLSHAALGWPTAQTQNFPAAGLELLGGRTGIAELGAGLAAAGPTVRSLEDLGC